MSSVLDEFYDTKIENFDSAFTEAVKNTNTKGNIPTNFTDENSSLIPPDLLNIPLI